MSKEDRGAEYIRLLNEFRRVEDKLSVNPSDIELISEKQSILQSILAHRNERNQSNVNQPK